MGIELRDMAQKMWGSTREKGNISVETEDEVELHRTEKGGGESPLFSL